MGQAWGLVSIIIPAWWQAQPIVYTKIIKITLGAYNAWKENHTKFYYYVIDDGKRVRLRRTDDQTNASSIVVEFDAREIGEGFKRGCVHIKECEWNPVDGNYQTSQNDWDIGAALYACHTFANKFFNERPGAGRTNCNNFASDLIQCMVRSGPSVGAIQIPDKSVGRLLPWGSQLGMNIQVCGDLSE